MDEPATGRHPAQAFPRSESSVALARRYTSQTLGDIADLDAALLVVSELTSNAVKYGAGEYFGLAFRIDAQIRIDVSDDSPVLPATDESGPPPPDHPRGRGLLIVAALSAEWGTTRTATGKTVWAVLAPTPTGAS
jgi:two-component sensor histidine kinase